MSPGVSIDLSMLLHRLQGADGSYSPEAPTKFATRELSTFAHTSHISVHHYETEYRVLPIGMPMMIMQWNWFTANKNAWFQHRQQQRGNMQPELETCTIP